MSLVIPLSVGFKFKPQDDPCSPIYDNALSFGRIFIICLKKPIAEFIAFFITGFKYFSFSFKFFIELKLYVIFICLAADYSKPLSLLKEEEEEGGVMVSSFSSSKSSYYWSFALNSTAPDKQTHKIKFNSAKRDCLFIFLINF